MKFFAVLFLCISALSTAHAGSLETKLDQAYEAKHIETLNLDLNTRAAKRAMGWIADRAIRVLKSNASEDAKNAKIDRLGKMALHIALTATEPDSAAEDDLVRQEYKAWAHRTRAPILLATAASYSFFYWLSAAPHFDSMATKAILYLVGGLPAAVAGLAMTGAVLSVGQERFYSELEDKMRAERAQEVLGALASILKEKTGVYYGTSQELHALVEFRERIAKLLNCQARLGG